MVHIVSSSNIRKSQNSSCTQKEQRHPSKTYRTNRFYQDYFWLLWEVLREEANGSLLQWRCLKPFYSKNNGISGRRGLSVLLNSTELLAQWVLVPIQQAGTEPFALWGRHCYRHWGYHGEWHRCRLWFYRPYILMDHWFFSVALCHFNLHSTFTSMISIIAQTNLPCRHLTSTGRRHGKPKGLLCSKFPGLW